MKLFLSEEKILKTEKRLENRTLQLKTKLIKRESTSKEL